MKTAFLQKEATETKERIISVCSFCKRQIGARLVAFGPALEQGPNQSHGVCRECAPGWFHRCGMSEADSRALLQKYTD